MLEGILQYLSGSHYVVIMVLLFFFAYIENLFPPSPSDVVVVVGVSILATLNVSSPLILFIVSLGSATGFVTMFFIGKYVGEKVLRKGRFKFISEESIAYLDKMFAKYGYYIIVANRFLPGTRAVISFFAGLHKLKPIKIIALATVSAVLWNVFLVYLGLTIGNNVKLIDYYLSTYTNTLLIVTGVLVVVLTGRVILKKYGNKS